MLTILRTARKVRNFIAYDLEWVPGAMSIRLCGVFDGAGYRAYHTMPEFLKAELTARNRGKWFFAHAGGLADVQFVLKELVRLNRAHMAETGSPEPLYRIQASFSGASAIIVHARRGQNSFHFVDSYWLLRDKLENIGEWIGLSKGAKAEREAHGRDWYRDAPLSDLLPYNRRDCEILYQAINKLEDALLELGGQLQMTLASCAMQLFRRRFLKRDIPTCMAVNEWARGAYFASRVEVFERECIDGHYFDINSSFPHAMTFPAPGELIASGSRLPDSGLYIADVELDSPEGYLPPLPYRHKGRVFFPYGRWRNWVTSVDLDLLREEGGRIHKVHEVLLFEPFHDLAEYVKELYSRRKAATSDFERIAYKLLLNSLYGKFQESNEKQRLTIDPPTIKDEWEMLFPGAFLQTLWVPIPHQHVPIGAHVTAIARRTLYGHLSSCSRVYYCDTDGLATDDILDTGPELGELKHETDIKRGLFAAPKVYRINDKVKAKGFSRLTVDKFERLIEGESIEYERMRRIKELYRMGRTSPEEVIIRKRLSGTTQPKRFQYPDGSTRAWHISELRGH